MKLNKHYIKEFSFYDQKIVIEHGHIAKRADQSFLIRWDKNAVLVTLCFSKQKSDVNFLPLTVEFQENLFSIGKIPGSFFRREGRASEYATLSGRIIDRSIRNLFPKNYNNEVQIFISPLAIDYSLDIRVPSFLATSLALNLSDLPFDNLFAGVVIGYINEKIIFNPNDQELKESKLNLILCGNEKGVNMIEVTANELSEEKLLEAIEIGHKKIVELIELQKEVLKDFNFEKKDIRTTEKESLIKLEKEVEAVIEKQFVNEIDYIVNQSSNYERPSKTNELEEKIKLFFEEESELSKESDFKESIIFESLSNILKKQIRDNIINNNKRLDQRKMDEIRPLSCEIDYLPGVHSSAIFTRGETQTLSTLTLAPLSQHKIIDDITTEESSYFLHHYRALPFSMGITGRMRGISRREIGHGALGKKALAQVLPNIEEFPYTVRTVTEVLSSDGSTSQAAICSTSLALLAGGVPIRRPVAGIGIGLIQTEKENILLTDIQAWEDFYGDMDFKISGTENGICSMQLDLKIPQLSIETIGKALNAAKKGRSEILGIMNKIINKSRSNVSKKALKFSQIKIDQEDIGLVIGPNGKNIKRIMANCDNPQIDIKEDGKVLIYHSELSRVEEVKKQILAITKPIEIDKMYEGTIFKLAEFGAFVRIDDINVSGLIHISNLSDKYVSSVNKILKVNDRVKVLAISINEKKKPNFKLLKKY